MKLLLTMSLDNSAYQYVHDDDSTELDVSAVAVNIRAVANDIERGWTKGIIMDYNGNKVGHWSID